MPVVARLSIIFGIVFLSGCRKDPALFAIDNLNQGNVLVFGHGGMGRAHRLPMNSEQSLLQCLGEGADGVEMDVRRTVDGHLLLFHDADLRNSTTCEGRVEEQRLEQLVSCRYKKNGREHSLISLRDFLKRQNTSRWFVFDCKTGKDSQENLAFADSLASLIQQHGISERAMIESPDIGFLQTISAHSPQAQLYLYTDHTDSAIAVSRRYRIDGLTIDIDRTDKAQIKKAHDAGLRVTLFNAATSNDNFSALSMDPDNIQTDRVRQLVRAYVAKRDN